MGCDIHCFIEYRSKPPHEGIEGWSSFGREVNIDRDYDLFSRMAGVRNYGDVIPISEPRGFPEDAGYDAREDNYLFIYDDPNAPNAVSRERAENYVRSGASHYVKGQGGKEVWVTCPDNHSHSWLTPDELDTCIRGGEVPQWRQNAKAMLAAMRSFEEQGFDSRVVFWFDN